MDKEKETLFDDGVSPVYTQSKIVNVSPEYILRKRLVAVSNQSQITDDYKVIRTLILQKFAENGDNTLLVTSSVRGEGKTLTAANLAITFAKEIKHTVLLVDGNLRYPGIGETFNLGKVPGLSDYLLGEVSLKNILINPGMEKLLL